MNSLFIFLLIGFSLIAGFFQLRHQQRFLKSYLKNRANIWGVLGQGLFIVCILLITLSLFDFKGESQKIETLGSSQNTIILIDNSSSMLVDDVRPNRFRRSILLARHFVKKAIGHSISVVVFSDIQKQVIPFTSDFELIDSRLEQLTKTRFTGGGSNLRMALKESLAYFQTLGNFKKGVGNVLVFTDSEEHDEFLIEDFPKGVSVALIGVGTEKGGKIPLMNHLGKVYGYKKNQKGEEITSKLDKKIIKTLGKKIPSFKYWIANSYSIHTEEILNFLQSEHKVKKERTEITIPKVHLRRVLIPALLIWFCWLLVRRKKRYELIGLFIFSFFCFSCSQKKQTEEEVKRNEYEVQEKFNEFRENNLTVNEKLKLATEIIGSDQIEVSHAIYKDIFEGNPENIREYSLDYLNYLMQSFILKPISRNLLKIDKYLLETSFSDKIVASVRKNIVKRLQEKKKEDKKKEQEKKDQQKKKDGENQEKSGEDGNPQENKEGDPKKGQNPKEGKEGDQKGQKQEQAQNDQKGPQSNRKGVKIKPLLRKILDEDTENQGKFFDTSTRNRLQKKDW